MCIKTAYGDKDRRVMRSNLTLMNRCAKKTLHDNFLSLTDSDKL